MPSLACACFLLYSVAVEQTLDQLKKTRGELDVAYANPIVTTRAAHGKKFVYEKVDRKVVVPLIGEIAELCRAVVGYSWPDNPGVKEGQDLAALKETSDCLDDIEAKGYDLYETEEHIVIWLTLKTLEYLEKIDFGLLAERYRDPDGAPEPPKPDYAAMLPASCSPKVVL